MIKTAKNLIIALFTIVLLDASMFVHASEAKVGSVFGKIYSTDILAYIDGVAIKSYNIGGKTVVSETDLPDYGFEVVWNAEARLLTIRTIETDTHFLIKHNTIARDRIGEIVGDVYHTDIKVVVNGLYVDAYNIGGITMIAIEDFGGIESMYDYQALGAVGYNPNQAIGYTTNGFRAVWSSEERTISLYTLGKGRKVQLDSGEYTISRLEGALKYTIGYLYHIKGVKETEWIHESMMLVGGFYSEDIFRAIFDGGWTLQDGELSIVVDEQTKKVITGVGDKDISSYIGDYGLGFFATNLPRIATTPIVIVPVRIVQNDLVTVTDIDGYVYDGQLFFDAEKLLGLADVLISTQ